MRTTIPAWYSDRVYHIFDHDQRELLEGGNIFGPIVLACQKALDEGKVSDMEMAGNRLLIARTLLRHKIGRERTIGLLVFIKNMLFVENEELNYKFDEQILQLTDNTIDMGVLELIRKRDLEKAEAEKLEMAREMAREMKKEGLTLEQISKITKLSIAEVEPL